jgi:uncharacterized repeat protein (TIGR01451 family)
VTWPLTAAVASSEERPRPVSERAILFGVTPPLRDVAGSGKGFDPASVDVEGEVPNRRLPGEDRQDLSVASVDAAVQDAPPAVTTIPGPTTSFEGLSSADNAAAFGFRVSPPDTNGDVGPNHYVQTTNLLVRVFDKSSRPLTPPFKLSSLFASVGGACATRDDGDPIALYDPLADRWLLSQFCTAATPFTHQMIAVSQTGDPTGAYFVYDFMMPNNKFNDYPKFGVWSDAYYMTDNQFVGNAFRGAGVFAFDRAKMLVGDPSAGYVYFDLGVTLPRAAGVLPADLDGQLPPPDGTPNLMAFFIAEEFGDPADALRLFEFHADFGDPARSTLVERPESPILVAAFDPRDPPGRRDVEQPPPATAANNLDSIQDRLMFRLQYRNSGGHESLVVAHTVNVSGLAPTTPATHQSGVRYYELRRSHPGGAFAVHEQATFAPDADNRWMGSAAADHQGNLAVGYSVASATTFPGVRYAGRLASDPPGGLNQGEAVLVDGSGVQLTNSSRWGDYSALTVDPADDCTFWYTMQYYTTASQATSAAGWLTRVGSFRFDACPPAPRGTIEGVAVDSATGEPVAEAGVTASGGFFRATDASGGYSMVVAPGSYHLTARRPNYAAASVFGVGVVKGGRTVQNFALVPIGADLSIDLVGPASIPAGSVLAYSIRLGNAGPLAATGVRVIDPVPDGTLFVSATTSQGSCDAPAPGEAGVVSCHLGTLPPGGSAIVTLAVHVSAAGGSIGNTAAVAGDQPDEITANNTAASSAFVSCLPLFRAVLGSGGPDRSGASGVQSGRLNRFIPPSSCAAPKANPGLAATTGERTYDAYPFANVNDQPACVTVRVDAQSCLGARFLYAAAYLGSFDPAEPSQNYLADLGGSPNPVGEMSFTVPPGESFVLVVHEVTPGAGCPGYSFSVLGLPCSVADLSVPEIGTPNPVLTGSDITYRVTVDNAGVNDAANPSLAHVIPAGTTFRSIDVPPGWSCTTPSVGGTGSITCGGAMLGPAETAAVAPVVRVDCALPDGTVIHSRAAAASETPDPRPFDNASSATTVAANPPPAISDVSVDRPALWPANRKLVDVALRYDVTDNCGPVTRRLSVASNEPVGDEPDWIVVDDHHVKLRAERSSKAGRVYTITVTATDSAGHATARTVLVTVPPRPADRLAGRAERGGRADLQ